MSRVGKNVRMHRERLSLTQEQLAARVHYSDASMIHQIEQGVKSPSLEKAQDLAVQLGVTLSQLVGDAGAYHTVTNHATGDHTVIQNIEGHDCTLDRETLTSIVQGCVRAGVAELGGKLAHLEATLRQAMPQAMPQGEVSAADDH